MPPVKVPEAGLVCMQGAMALGGEDTTEGSGEGADLGRSSMCQAAACPRTLSTGLVTGVANARGLHCTIHYIQECGEAQTLCMGGNAVARESRPRRSWCISTAGSLLAASFAAAGAVHSHLTTSARRIASSA